MIKRPRFFEIIGPDVLFDVNIQCQYATVPQRVVMTPNILKKCKNGLKCHFLGHISTTSRTTEIDRTFWSFRHVSIGAWSRCINL